MKDIEIKISKETRQVELNKYVIGNDGENLQGNLMFTFDEFVNGQARLEYDINGSKQYAPLDKVGETYQTPILSVITKSGQIDMQLVVTEGTDETEIPIFKSNIFYLTCNASINAEIEQPEEYEEWIDIANTKLNEVDNLDIDMQDNVVTITRKDGTQYSENVKGDDYVITEEDYNVIENQVKTDIQPILENIENTSEQAELIARGRAQSVVKETFEELEEWLRDVNNKGTHNIGDNLYIKAEFTDNTETERQPDYWIAEVLEEPNEKGYYYEISKLGAETPDLTDYAKKEQFVTLTQTEYDALTEKSANTYYFIIEEE